MSPVLQSFLAGSKNQESIIDTANKISQAREASQQRQQTIDDVMKRFDKQNTLEQRRVDLETGNAADQHELHMLNARQAIIEGLSQHPETAPGAVHIPGISAPNVPQTQIPPTGGQSLGAGVQQPSGGGTSFAIPGYQTPDTTQGPAVGSPVTVGGITVPMPQSANANAVAQKEALLPAFKAEQEAEADAYVKKMQPSLMNKLQLKEVADEASRQNWQMRIDSANSNAQLRAQVAESLGQGKMQFELQKLLGFGDPSEIQGRVTNNAALLARGELDPTNITNPLEKTMTGRALNNAGYVVPPKGTNQKVMDHVTDAETFLQAMDQMKSQIGTPSNLVQRGLNTLSTTKGLGFINPQYSSVYNNFQTTVTPGLEKSLGFTLAGGRGAAVMDRLKALTPTPADPANVYNEKIANGLDIHMSAIAKEIAGLPQPQRKLFYQQILDEHPTMLRNGTVGQKLVKAATNGNYVPGLQP